MEPDTRCHLNGRLGKSIVTPSARKGADHSLAALKSIRAARPDGAPIYVIMDNVSANKTPAIRTWAKRHKVELCLTPTSASWATRSRPSSAPYARS
jgi:hypothetical protein